MRNEKASYIGLYGNINLTKEWCNKCDSYSFVISGKLVCCGAHQTQLPQLYKRESIPEQRRKTISAKEKKIQLEKQDYRCFYCGKNLGSLVFRKSKPVKLKTEWDHMIPYSLTQNNEPTNFVAACHICNRLKSSSVFQTVDEAKIYLLSRWEEKGYTKNLNF